MDTPTHYLVHIGYALMLCALIARDILWLRGLLVVAQSFLTAYALVIGVPSIAGWNALFVLINTVWVARIIRERQAVEVPGALKAIYDRHFAALTAAEFLRFWDEGERKTARDRQLVASGQRPVALYFLLQGEAAVLQGMNEVARLPQGSFLAEMSLLTGEPATADVRAAGMAEFMEWPVAQLDRIRARNPVLWTKIQSVLGLEVVRKLQRASQMDH
jgi:CRP-like cAMP-binding protein